MNRTPLMLFFWIPVGALLLLIFVVGLWLAASSTTVVIPAPASAPTVAAATVVDHGEGEGTLSGTIVWEGDPPENRKIYLDGFSKRTRSSGSTYSHSSSLGEFEDTFQAKLSAGETYLYARHPDYALSWIGPLDNFADGNLENLVITMKKGVPLELTVIDPNGKPLPGANLTGYPVIGRDGGSHYPIKELGEGKYLIQAVPEDVPYQVYVKLAGFEPHKELVEHASSLGHYTIELTPAKPTTGMVVDHLGYPVADAELFMQLRIQKGHGSHSYGGNGELVAKTDGAGKFVLDQIPSDGKIFVLVKTPAGERVVAKPIGAGEKDLLIEIPHQRTLKGIIRGDLSLLGERYFVGAKPHTKRPYVKIDQRYQHEIEQNHHHGEMVYDYIEVIPGDGQGEFEFKGIFQDEVEIKLGPYQAKLNLQEYSYDDVIVLEYNVETADQKISSRPAETSQSVPEPAGTSE